MGYLRELASRFLSWFFMGLVQPAGNRERGRVEVQAQGRRWVLRLNMNHLLVLCDRLGVKDDEGISKALLRLASQIGTIHGLRTAVHVALMEHHPGLTEEQVGELITEIGFERTGNLVIDTLHWAMPEPEEKGVAGRGKGQAASTGGATIS